MRSLRCGNAQIPTGKFFFLQVTVSGKLKTVVLSLAVCSKLWTLVLTFGAFFAMRQCADPHGEGFFLPVTVSSKPRTAGSCGWQSVVNLGPSEVFYNVLRDLIMRSSTEAL